MFGFFKRAFSPLTGQIVDLLEKEAAKVELNLLHAQSKHEEWAHTVEFYKARKIRLEYELDKRKKNHV